MASKAKKKKSLVLLVSTALTKDGRKTGSFYVRKKSPKLKEKFAFMKYDCHPDVRKHVLFKEEKMK